MVNELLADFTGEVGKGFVKLVWQDEGFQRGMNTGEVRLMAKVIALLEYYAPQVENWMKDNAPWEDQTGNARNGLAARAFHDDEATGIILYHQVPYGIWLEVRFSGEYAIITPALEYWGPKVMEGMRGMLGDI